VPSPIASLWPITTPSIFILTLIAAMVLLYFGRAPAHNSISSFCRVIRNGLRLASFAVLRSEKRLHIRNREVLLAAGLLRMERDIEKEFQRVERIVQRDMQGYPSLHRKLSEEISRLDQDYSESTEAPPTPPVWVNAVESVADLAQKNGGDSMVGSILKDVHTTIIRQQQTAMAAYRENTGRRHKILGSMMPYWRRLAKVLEEVGSTVNNLGDRAKIIDQKMAAYEEIRSDSNKAAIILHSSSLTQFFIAAFWVLVAMGAIVVNFHLISLPMAEMVGGSAHIGGYPLNEIAALVVILIATFAGLALLEALRITKFFPGIGSLDAKERRFIALVAVGFLFAMAGIESALAYMRDLIAANDEALRLSLLMESGETMDVARSIIPTVAQMLLGFILPFALTFALIPFEAFVHSARTVLGYGLELLLRLGAGLIRLVANLVHYSGSLLVALYDLIIFLPLWVEKKLQGLGRPQESSHQKNKEETRAKEAKAL